MPLRIILNGRISFYCFIFDETVLEDDVDKLILELTICLSFVLVEDGSYFVLELFVLHGRD